MPLKEIILLSAITAMFLIVVLKKQGGTFVKSGLYGILGLIVVNLTSFVTGIAISINVLNLLATVLLGLPGVVLVLILRLL